MLTQQHQAGQPERDKRERERWMYCQSIVFSCQLHCIPSPRQYWAFTKMWSAGPVGSRNTSPVLRLSWFRNEAFRDVSTISLYASMILAASCSSRKHRIQRRSNTSSTPALRKHSAPNLVCVARSIVNHVRVDFLYPLPKCSLRHALIVVQY